MPTPGDQNTLGKQTPSLSCTGWSVGYGLMSVVYAKLEKNVGENGNKYDYNGDDKKASPTYIYNLINGGQNVETAISTALDRIRLQGSCKWVDMPGNIHYSVTPSAQIINNSQDYINDGFGYRLQHQLILDRIKDYIDDDMPLPINCSIDDSFVLLKGYNVVPLPDGRLEYMEYNKHIKNRPRTRHNMVVCGYDDNIQAFKLMNSVGDKWGNGGFIWVDYECFKELVIYDNPKTKAYPYIFYPFAKMANVAISTKDPKDISGSSATIEFTTNSTSGTTVKQTGVCYSMKRNPTTAWGKNDSTVVSTTGKAKITGLKANTKYYVRAFAKTNRGVAYGNTKEFTTLEDLSGKWEISQVSATCPTTFEPKTVSLIKTDDYTYTATLQIEELLCKVTISFDKATGKQTIIYQEYDTYEDEGGTLTAVNVSLKKDKENLITFTVTSPSDPGYFCSSYVIKLVFVK